jgi:hypothetical protein
VPTSEISQSVTVAQQLTPGSVSDIVCGTSQVTVSIASGVLLQLGL